MPENLNLVNAAATSILAGVASAIYAAILVTLLPVGTGPSVGVFPVVSNFIELFSIVFGVLTGVLVMERRAGRNLYSDTEVAVGAFLAATVGVLTVGLGVPPFNLAPLMVSVTVTIMVETFLFSLLALAFARATDWV